MKYGLELYLIQAVIQIIRWTAVCSHMKYSLQLCVQLYELHCVAMAQIRYYPSQRPEFHSYLYQADNWIKGGLASEETALRNKIIILMPNECFSRYLFPHMKSCQTLSSQNNLQGFVWVKGHKHQLVASALLLPGFILEGRSLRSKASLLSDVIISLIKLWLKYHLSKISLTYMPVTPVI